MPCSEIFDRHRPLLAGIARRMLGSAVEAEDIVQEAFVRWQAVEEEVVAPRQFLATVVTRLCFDQLKSARRQRESLSDALEIAGGGDDPERIVALANTLTAAFTRMLQRLTAIERAVFLLAEAFDFEHAEIAGIVGKSEDNCRQILRRARERLAIDQQRFRADAGVAEELTRRFIAACTAGDVEALLVLLANDVVIEVETMAAGATYGRVRAVERPVQGADKVAHFLAAVQRQAPATYRYSLIATAAGPAVLTYEHGEPHSLLRLEVAGDRIRRIAILVAADR